MQWRMVGRRGRYASWTIVGDAGAVVVVAARRGGGSPSRGADAARTRTRSASRPTTATAARSSTWPPSWPGRRSRAPTCRTRSARPGSSPRVHEVEPPYLAGGGPRGDRPHWPTSSTARSASSPRSTGWPRSRRGWASATPSASRCSRRSTPRAWSSTASWWSSRTRSWPSREAGIRTLYVVLTRATQQLDIVGPTQRLAAVALPAPAPGRHRARPRRSAHPHVLLSMTSTSAPAFALVRLQGDDHVTLLRWPSGSTTTRSPTCRSTRAVRDGQDRSTAWSVCRSRRSASAGSRRTTTTRRCQHRGRRPAPRSRSTSCSPSSRTSRSTTDRRARASTSTTRRTPTSSGASSTTRSATARAPTSSSRRNYDRDHRRLGPRQGADRLPSAARARARRLLDVPRLHRRPVPDRREPGAARQRAGRRGPDEPDQRHVPRRADRRPGRAQGRGCSSSSPTRRRSTSSSWSSTRS